MLGRLPGDAFKKGEGKKKNGKGVFLKCATRCQGKVRHYCAAEAAMEDHPAARNTQRQVLLWLLTHTRFLPRIYSETRKCFHHKP